MIITLSNTCSLDVNDKVQEILKNYVYNYNRENGTNYSTNDVQSVRITTTGISFRFSINFCVVVSFEELEYRCDK